ncbi:MAG: hypothetical protein RL635_1253, partial [Chloroflexota bacterium]
MSTVLADLFATIVSRRTQPTP